MAKKAKKAVMKQAPRAKPSGNKGVVIGVVVAVVVIIALIFLLKGGYKAPTGPAVPTAPTAPTEPGKKTVELSPTPEFNQKCASANKVTAVTLTYVAGTCKLSEGTVSFTMKNPSKSTDIEGVYFEATGSDGKKGYQLDNEVVGPGESKTYTVSISDLASGIGESVTDFIVYPAQAGKACFNSRSIIINKETCA